MLERHIPPEARGEIDEGRLREEAKKVAKEWLAGGRTIEDFPKWHQGGMGYPKIERRRYIQPEGQSPRWTKEEYHPGNLLSEAAEAAGVPFDEKTLDKIERMVIEEMEKIQSEQEKT